MPYFLTFVKRYDLLRFAGAIRLFSQMFTRVQSYADGLDSMPQVPGDVKGFLADFFRVSRSFDERQSQWQPYHASFQ